MRRAKSFDDEALAERAVNHLLTCGIDGELRESDSAYDLWVHDDRHMDRAKAELERFLAAPDAPEFAESGKKAAELRAKKDEELSSRRNCTIDVRTERHRRAMEIPVFTSLLIALCVAIAMLTKLGEERFPFLDRLAFSSLENVDGRLYFRGLDDILGGQIWRLVTPMFIHFGPLHLLFNMMWLKDLGGQIEKEYGWAALLGLVVATAAPSNLLQYWWAGAGFGGMSGVTSGLLGYIWMRSKYEPGCRVDVDDGTFKYMMVYLVVCTTGAFGSIANAAHFGGLGMGCLLGGGPYLARRFWRRFRG